MSIPGKYDLLTWAHLASETPYRMMLASIDGVRLYVVCKWGDDLARLYYEIQKDGVVLGEQEFPNAALKAFNAARGLS